MVDSDMVIWSGDRIATKPRVCGLIVIVCLTLIAFMGLSMTLTRWYEIPKYVSTDYVTLFPWYWRPIVVGIEVLAALGNPLVITAAVWYFDRFWIGLSSVAVCVFPSLVFALIAWEFPMHPVHFAGMLGLEATVLYAFAILTKPIGQLLAPRTDQTEFQFSILDLCLLTAAVAGACFFSRMDGVDSGYNILNYVSRSSLAFGTICMLFARWIRLSAIISLISWILGVVDFSRLDQFGRNEFSAVTTAFVFVLLTILIRKSLGSSLAHFGA